MNITSAQYMLVPPYYLYYLKQLLNIAIIYYKLNPYSKYVRYTRLGLSYDDVLTIFYIKVNQLVIDSLLKANPKDPSYTVFKSDIEGYIKLVTIYQYKQKRETTTIIPSTSSKEPLSSIDLELLYIAQSINRNLFRLVNLGREVAGFPILEEDKEEVYLE